MGAANAEGKEKKKFLVVDDVEINRLILKNLFTDEFDVIEAENGKVALDLLAKFSHEIDMVLLDIIMPEKDGFEVLQAMNETGLISKIPVVLITGENDDEKALRGYSLGVTDLVNKPFNPEIVYKRVKNILDLYTYRHSLEERLREQKEKLDEQARRIQQANQHMIDALSTTVEFRNVESGEHIKRMRAITRIILEASSDYYPLSLEEINIIASASAMHDIGKIAIPDRILLKPGRLTEEEFEIMKSHAERGCEILDTLVFAQDKEYHMYSYEICRHHHERWDGNGYPDGLKGDEISIWAQAASLADVYDALTSKRVYKEAYSHKESVDMILNGECGVFNPKMLECFMKIESTLMQRIQDVKNREKE